MRNDTNQILLDDLNNDVGVRIKKNSKDKKIEITTVKDRSNKDSIYTALDQVESIIRTNESNANRAYTTSDLKEEIEGLKDKRDYKVEVVATFKCKDLDIQEDRDITISSKDNKVEEVQLLKEYIDSDASLDIPEKITLLDNKAIYKYTQEGISFGLLVNDDNSCRIINEYEVIKILDNDVRYNYSRRYNSDSRSKIDYQKIKPVQLKGDEVPYITRDKISEPLFREAEDAISLAQSVKPLYKKATNEIKSLFEDSYLDLQDKHDGKYSEKSVRSLATKLWKKNRDNDSYSFSGKQTKDFFRDTLILKTEDITIDNLIKIRGTLKSSGFDNVKLELKTAENDPNNPYYGIHFTFSKDGITSELQVSCKELYEIKQKTEYNYKYKESLDRNSEEYIKLVKEDTERYQKFLDGNPSLKSLFASSNEVGRVSKSRAISTKEDDMDVLHGDKTFSSIDETANNDLSLTNQSLPDTEASFVDQSSNNNLSPSLSLKSDISNSSSNNHSISQSDSDYELVKVDDKVDIVDDAIFTQYKKTEIDRNIERNPTSKLVKEASKGKTISVYLSRKMIKTLSDHFSTLLNGATYKDKYFQDGTTSENLARRVMISYNLDNSKDKVEFDSQLDKVLDAFLSRKVISNDDTKMLRDMMSTNEVEDISKDLKKTIKQYLDNNSKNSSNLNHVIYERELKNTIGKINKTYSICIQANKLKQRMIKDANRSQDRPSAAQPIENESYSQVYYSLVGKGGKLTQCITTNGITSRDIKALSDLTYKDFCFETQEDFESDIDFYPIRTALEELQYCLQENNYTNDLDAKELSVELLNRMWQNNRESARKQRIERKVRYQGLKIEAMNGLKASHKKSALFNAIDKARGMESRISELFSENSQIYDAMFRKPALEHAEIARFEQGSTDRVNTWLKQYNLTESKLSTKTGIIVDDIDLSLDQALAIYARLNSDEALDLKTNGFQLKDKKKGGTLKAVHLDDDKWADFIIDMDYRLNSDEKNFALEILKNGYNGYARDEIIQYQKKHGIKIIDDEDKDSLYMHTERANLRGGERKDSTHGIGFTATGISKRRVKNRQEVSITGLLEDYNSYIRSVSKTTKLDDVRELNSMLRSRTFTRTNNDTNTQTTSVYNLFSENMRDGKAFIDEWLDRIALRDLNTGKGSSSKIITNAYSAPILFNVGTWFKMMLDPLRTIPNVGIKNAFTGIVKGLTLSLTKAGLATWIKLKAVKDIASFVILLFIYDNIVLI